MSGVDFDCGACETILLCLVRHMSCPSVLIVGWVCHNVQMSDHMQEHTP